MHVIAVSVHEYREASGQETKRTCPRNGSVWRPQVRLQRILRSLSVRGGMESEGWRVSVSHLRWRVVREGEQGSEGSVRNPAASYICEQIQSPAPSTGFHQRRTTAHRPRVFVMHDDDAPRVALRTLSPSPLERTIFDATAARRGSTKPAKEYNDIDQKIDQEGVRVARGTHYDAAAAACFLCLRRFFLVPSSAPSCSAS